MKFDFSRFQRYNIVREKSAFWIFRIHFQISKKRTGVHFFNLRETKSEIWLQIITKVLFRVRLGLLPICLARVRLLRKFSSFWICWLIIDGGDRGVVGAHRFHASSVDGTRRWRCWGNQWFLQFQKTSFHFSQRRRRTRQCRKSPPFYVFIFHHHRFSIIMFQFQFRRVLANLRFWTV